MHKTFITQSQFDDMVGDLGKKIEERHIKFLYTIGIERGGLYVSKPLTNYLLTNHRSIRISFYSEKDTLNPEPIYDFKNIDFDYVKRTQYLPFLLVDDLLDTASTLNWFIEKTGMVQGKNFYFACLYYNPNNKYGLKPDFYISEKPESWVVFPHEVDKK